MSKRWLLYFKNINVSTFSGRRRQRWSVMTSPAVLKSLSEGTLVGGGDRNFYASVDRWQNLWMFIFHQEAGSSWRLMRGSDKYWSNSAFMQLPVSVLDWSAADASWSIVSKQFHRLDPVCFSTDCSLLAGKVEDDCCDMVLSAEGVTTADANSRCARAALRPVSDFPVDAISKILFLDTLLQPNTTY